MGPDDFIDLDANNHESEGIDLDRVDFRQSETDCWASAPQMKEGVPSSPNIETLEGNSEEEEDQHVQDMDLEDDLVPFTTKKGDLVRIESIQESIRLVATPATVDEVNEVEPNKDKENSRAVLLNDIKSNNLLIDESPLAGVKRARMAYVDKQPSVRVIYSSLTRESKRKLMELMQHWSEWQAQCQSSSNASPEEALEYGEETYFPALHVGSAMSTTVSFWLDNQARREDVKEVDSDLIPLYNREYTLGSTPIDGSTNSKGRTETLEASRCFNCGSYSHSLKECPKPRDNVAISNARKQHISKRNPAAGSRGQTRYYQKAPGKFDDLRAGVLGAETRECLGIGEYDPPPWLHRMREMGYPPGYLDVIEDEDQPSGITIYADEEIQEDYEDGELPEKGELEPPERRMTVEFPGINAPIPENADYRRWATPPTGYSGSMSIKSRPHAQSNRSAESHRERYHDQRWSTDRQDDGPPGLKHGPPSSMASHSPRYSPYDHNRIPRSPSQGGSLSDRGWWSPLPFESSPARTPHSPHTYAAQQSPQYQSSTSHEHWKQETTFRMSPHTSQGRDRHDHRRHHHRR